MSYICINELSTESRFISSHVWRQFVNYFQIFVSLRSKIISCEKTIYLTCLCKLDVCVIYHRCTPLPLNNKLKNIAFASSGTEGFPTFFKSQYVIKKFHCEFDFAISYKLLCKYYNLRLWDIDF